MTVPKYARIERERRFLICDDPHALCVGDHSRIRDSYITGTRLRLRRIIPSNGGAAVFKLCKKYGAISDTAEPIVNVYLTAAEYHVLADLEGALIEKRRYHAMVDGVRFAIDVFEGALTGLFLAEVEAADAAALQGLAIPNWVTCEVTADPWFGGGHLATVTHEMLHDQLYRLGKS